MTIPDFWTEERIERLGELWGDGLSAAKIGREIGCTKNAVISKAHRLGLSARPSPIKRDGPSYVRPRRPSRRAPSLPLPSLDPMPKQIDAPPPAAPRRRVFRPSISASGSRGIAHSPPAASAASRR